MSLISIDNVSKNFGSVQVLKGVSLDVAAGEVVALIGKSGSGKSTMLRCVNGLEKPDSGRIVVDGVELTAVRSDLRKLRLKVGMVFQQFNLYPHLSAQKNIMLALTIVKNIERDEAAEIAKTVLRRVGLLEKASAFPTQLSGGQQQRVAIARAIAMQPRALLCDEITSALDPELVSEVLAVVGELAADGMTLVLVTHEMRFARQVCDRVAFMHQGTIHEIGSPDSFFDAPQTRELQQFLGLTPALCATGASSAGPDRFMNTRAAA